MGICLRLLSNQKQFVGFKLEKVGETAGTINTIVVKEGLLRTMEKEAGEKCCEEMKGAWSEAYDQLFAAIQAEMAKVAAAAQAEETQEPSSLWENAAAEPLLKIFRVVPIVMPDESEQAKALSQIPLKAPYTCSTA
ncbi:non-symbiotic hemoglobin 2 [Artemisia annua]|uniref:Non-symbiotic hemoglobin 2 n=1 Tax=Artemisia annua TaxID=35608 RepID=A0A2U1MJL8_ARTAN|nr:non-symbiotic hemoglobin 2 [Artemisia annua]